MKMRAWAAGLRRISALAAAQIPKIRSAEIAIIVAATAPLEGLLDLAMAEAARLAPLGANRELYGSSKERIFGEAPSVNDRNGAAYYLRNYKGGH